MVFYRHHLLDEPRNAGIYFAAAARAMRRSMPAKINMWAG
jgi:hypothetical protein